VGSERFAIEFIPADEVVSRHWRMVDGVTGKRYYLDSKGECLAHAAEVLGIEAGVLEAPEPVEKVQRVWKYEGLWRNGVEIDLKTGLPKPNPEELF